MGKKVIKYQDIIKIAKVVNNRILLPNGQKDLKVQNFKEMNDYKNKCRFNFLERNLFCVFSCEPRVIISFYIIPTTGDSSAFWAIPS